MMGSWGHRRAARHITVGLWCGLFALGASSASASTFAAACSNGTGDADSLISAINQANAAIGADVVQLGAGCTYTLTAVDNNWYGPNGLPPIASDITIEGSGATITRAAAAPPFRLFFVGADPSNPSTSNYVTPGPGTLTLRDVTVTGGDAQGGSSNGGGGGAGMGGALFNEGSVVIDHSTFSGSLAKGGAANDPSAGRSGGGMGTSSTVGGGGFGTGSFGGGTGGGLSPNMLFSGGGAGFAAGENGLPATNSGPGGGGGPQTGLGGLGGGAGCGGALPGDGSGAAGTGDHPDGPGGGFGQGGAPAHGGGGGGAGGGVGGGGGDGGFGCGGGGGFGGGGGAGNLDSGHGGNGGFGGGGGSGAGAFGGPGFGGGSATSTDGGSGAGMGGAIFNMQGSLTISDSTIAGNAAVGGADNVPDSGKGIAGGVFNMSGTFTAVGSTFAGNSAAFYAAQIYNLVYDGHQARTAQTTLRDTIVADGVASPLWPYEVASDKTAFISPSPDLGTAVADVSQFDLVRAMNAQESGTVTGSPLTADPILGPLQNNGGLTPTMRLMPGSPAIGAGDAGCVSLSGLALLVDQRGVARPFGAACDIGAYEVAPPIVGTESASASSVSTAALAGTVTPNATDAAVHFEYGTSTGYGSQTAVQHLAGVTASGISAHLAGLLPRTTYHYRLVGVSADGTGAGADQTFTTPSVVPTALAVGRPLASGTGVIVAVRCRAPLGVNCRATAVLTTLEHLLGRGIVGFSARKKRHTQRVVIGSTRFSLSAGQTRRITVPLNRTGTRLVARFGRLPATLKITLLGVKPPTVLVSTTTIKRKPAHKRHR
jgi:hypothetical protein